MIHNDSLIDTWTMPHPLPDAKIRLAARKAAQYLTRNACTGIGHKPRHGEYRFAENADFAIRFDSYNHACAIFFENRLVFQSSGDGRFTHAPVTMQTRWYSALYDWYTRVRELERIQSEAVEGAFSHLSLIKLAA